MRRPYATVHIETGRLNTDAADGLRSDQVRLEAPPYEAAFDTDRFVRIPVTAARAITQQYAAVGQYEQLVDTDDQNYVTVRKPADELRDAAWSLENAPLTLGHPDANIVQDTDDVRGFVRNVEWDDDREALTASVYVPATDDSALEWIEAHDHVSVGFFFDIDTDVDGDVDAAQRNILFDHLAVVEQGRCSREDGCGLGLDTAVAADMTASIHAATDALREGSWVKWDWSGGTAYGKITDVITEAGETVSAAGNEREATDDRNAYKLRSWDDNTQSWGSPVVKLENENNLRRWTDPPSNTPALDECSSGPCRCGRHTALTDAQIDASVAGEEIDLTPPEAAQRAAQRVLDWRDDNEKTVTGMTDTGWSRAEQLAAGEALNPSDIVSGTDAMAPWWSRHRPHTLVETDDGYELARDESVPKHKDNSYVAGLGWGGVAGYRWAIRTGNEIHAARGAEEPYTLDSQHGAVQIRRSPTPLTLNVPSWSSTTDNADGRLRLSDFTDEQWGSLDAATQTEITNHFLVIRGGEQLPGRFSDLKLPVVSADGALVLNWLQSAYRNAGQVDGASKQFAARVREMVDNLIAAEFSADEIPATDSEHTQQAYTQTAAGSVRFHDTKDGSLDESAIPAAGFASHYLEAGDTKSTSAFPVVDADGYLRRGNVDAAFQLYGHADDETELLQALASLNDEFDDPPINESALQEAQAANDTITLTETTIDMPDTTVTISADDDVVETLTDNFDEVAAMVDEAAELEGQLEAAQERIDDLESALDEYRMDEKRELVDEITTFTDYWSEDDLLDTDIDTLEERLDVVKSAATDSGVSTPEVDTVGAETDDTTNDETEYERGETYDLSHTA